MPRPLSVDLRKRVIAAIDGGMRVKDAAKQFDVCCKVIYNWVNLRKKTNSLEPKSDYQRGHSHKIKDYDSFKAFVDEQKYCTIPEMKAKWNEQTNSSVGKDVIRRALKKIGYTYKKKPLATWRQIH